MLKLYQFPRSKRFPNYSPYCVKLETYLKIADIPYQSVFTLNLSKNPRKQMPYIELDGKIIGDSSFIIDELIKLHGDKVDNWLTPEQRVVSVAFQRLLENHLGLILMYFRWVHPQGWSQFREILFAKSPRLIKILVGKILNNKVKRRLSSNPATANFTVDELLQRAKKDLDALANYLGDKEYMFGDKISSIDGSLLGVFGGITCISVETPFKDLANQYDNLKKHSFNILKQYYGS